jgi:hypothetical protein
VTVGARNAIGGDPPRLCSGPGGETAGEGDCGGVSPTNRTSASESEASVRHDDPCAQCCVD